MSQRPAWIAAAIATAEVSEPPRPSVVIRPVNGLMPWKPAITATSLRSLKRLISSDPSISKIRAEAWASEVRIGICQPCQERASMPIVCSAMASRPAVTCSPEATTTSYSRASWIGEASWHHSTSSLVLPAIADTTTAISWPASTSRFTCRATLRIRSVFATDVPPNFITRRPMTTGAFPERLSNVACAQNRSAPTERRVYITARLRASNRVPALPRNVRVSSGRVAIEADCMGRYIDDILQPGEKVLYSTNAHWIFFLPAIAAWIVAFLLFLLSRQTTTEGIVLLCLSAAAVVAIVALYWTVKAWFHRWTTETDVTNMRVVHKTGFVTRKTFEMSLDKVESVDVNQSILGRILNYGSVTVRGVGEGAETIDTIASPLDFRNHITAR